MRKKLKLGKAFPDQFKKVSFKYHHYKHKGGDSLWQQALISDESQSFVTSFVNPWIKLFFITIVMIFFAILCLRLVHLQVVEGRDNRELADSNRIQVKVIHAPRGVIYDRNGQILAQNEPGFRLIEATNSAKVVSRITRDQAVQMEVKSDPRLKDLEIDSIRTYPQLEKTSHILGYVGEITEEELKQPEFANYSMADLIGRSGIEQSYEKVLKGIDGGEVIEVDAQGKKLRTLRKTEAIPGQNIYLALDANLQAVAYEKLKEGITKAKSCCGAVVILEPNNGQVLSLVSIPSFDPANLNQSLAGANSPLLNRAIGGVYPPGSTFKIASALAGLNSGKVTSQTIYEDTGVINLGPFKFANWYFTQYGRTEGSVDIVKALKRSNDIYFYRLGEAIGENTLGQFSKNLGLGKKTGIDIPGEEAGLIPDNAWKEENFNQSWYPGDTLHMAIGQGFVLTTPIQIANLVSLVAADGKGYPPHLAYKITTPTGKVIKEFKFDGSDRKIKAQDLSLVKQGLEQVPKEGGTAWPFFPFPINTAGKTGTAEFGGADKTHAWYTSYAPVQNPQISITVLVEGGGEGSSVASPIAKEIYRYYFSQDKKDLIKDIGQVVATDSGRTLGE